MLYSVKFLVSVALFWSGTCFYFYIDLKSRIQTIQFGRSFFRYRRLSVNSENVHRPDVALTQVTCDVARSLQNSEKNVPECGSNF